MRHKLRHLLPFQGSGKFYLMLQIVTELRFDKPFKMLARPTGGDVSPEIESISHARKSARDMTVEVTVDDNMREQIARFYAGLQAQEIIEWGT
jgi:hypothetical protein